MTVIAAVMVVALVAIFGSTARGYDNGIGRLPPMYVFLVSLTCFCC